MALATSQCTFCIALWNEETTREFPDGSKLTRADVSQTYDGDMSGDGNAEYLMAYTPEGPSSSSGLEVLNGSIGGRQAPS